MQRLIVKFNPINAASDDTVESLIEDLQTSVPGLTLVRPPSRSGRAVFAVEPDVGVIELAAELSHNKKIAYAEPEIIDRAAEEE